MAHKKQANSSSLDKRERRQQAQRARRQQKKAEQLKRRLKIIGVSLAIVLVGVGGVLLFSGQAKLYPPISSAGHIETWPAQRISTVPIPLPVQAHIIEHIPGGTHGVLLEYNCTRFKCKSDLVTKLTTIAERYSYIYLAPYPQMGAKIALAARNRRLVLNQYDKAKIIAFLTP